MSGIEVVGIVLGALPILCSTAKSFRNRYKDVHMWWQFDREFADFISEIEREYVAFSQIMEILLDPLDSITEKEKEMILDDPHSTLLFTPRIQVELKQRVQTKYFSWFIRELVEINEAIEQLHALLPIGKAHHLDSKSLESELYRLKMSFSHEKEKHLRRISEGNKALYEFLDRASHLSRSPTPNSIVKVESSAISSVINTQEQARCLLKCLQRHWNCGCATGSTHPCSITVREANVRMLFEEGNSQIQYKIDVVPTELPQPAALAQKTSKTEELLKLGAQTSTKSRLRRFKDKGPKGIVGFATSSISAFASSESLETSRSDENPKESFLKRTFIGTSSTSRRRVQFETDADPNMSSPAPPPSNTTVLGQPIDNICSMIRSGLQDPKSGLGYLEAEKDTKIYLGLDSNYQPSAACTFESFLAATPRRDRRLRLGMSLIVNIISLGPDWISEDWSRKSLLIRSHGDANSLDDCSQPYIQHNSVHQTLHKPSPRSTLNREKARAALLTLGILLLELLFRDTLERQPFRAEFLSNGQPNEFTDFCTAWRWQAKVEEEFGNKIAGAITLCLKCEFDSPDLESRTFLGAVWAAVVKPIEEFLQAYG
ncbi:hypothetical protein HJFPF1_04587 [Paramyrothecium foliicola]|nr:hypothetical protein HJFPF1_04587 [Paramyrothecium foliicola]